MAQEDDDKEAHCAKEKMPSSLSPLTVSWKCNFSMTPHVRLLAGVFFGRPGRHNFHAACQRNETEEVGTYK